MHIPWWLWAVVVVVLLALLVRGALRWTRRRIRDRFVQFLQERHPEMEVVKVTDDAVLTRTERHGETVINLRTIYSNVLSSDARTPEDELPIFEAFMAAFAEHDRAAQEPLSLEACTDRLMPRLVPKGFYDRFPQGAGAPCTPVESLGLDIVYVLDAADSVRFLTRADLDELALTLEQLHDRSMENLRGTFPTSPVEEALAEPALVAVKNMDSYDATRLLLVPEYLQPGQELAALIPDRDTLVLVRVSPDFDWRKLDKLARTPASGKVLLSRPVKVTHEGFQIM